MLVPIILGSESDRDHAEKITKVLDEFDVKYEIKVLSAHKVPEKVFDAVTEYNKQWGVMCYITIAGRSNGLSGVVAANSIHPVIACPPFADKDDFTVNINSSLQMPSDTPVMTVIDPKNAALAAVKILATSDSRLQKKVLEKIESVKATFNS